MVNPNAHNRIRLVARATKKTAEFWYHGVGGKKEKDLSLLLEIKSAHFQDKCMIVSVIW